MVSDALSWEHNPSPRRVDLWERRIRAMAVIPGGLSKMQEFLDEVSRRQTEADCARYGYNGVIRNPGAWLSTQSELWEKKHRATLKGET
jgi:hypothetical protein